jgi:hypothetical protein
MKYAWMLGVVTLVGGFVYQSGGGLEDRVVAITGTHAKNCGMFVGDEVKKEPKKLDEALACVIKASRSDGDKASRLIIFLGFKPDRAIGLLGRPDGTMYSFAFDEAGVCGKVGKCEPWFPTGICETPTAGGHMAFTCGR